MRQMKNLMGGQNAHRGVRAEESEVEADIWGDIEMTLQDCWLLQSQHLWA